jgi:hypothetical protein
MDITPYEEISDLVSRAEMHINMGMPGAANSEIRAAERIGMHHGIMLTDYQRFLRQQAGKMQVLEDFYILLDVYHAPDKDAFDDSDLYRMFFDFKDTLDYFGDRVAVPDELKEVSLVFDIVRTGIRNEYATIHVNEPIRDICGLARAESWFMKQSWYGYFMQRLGWEQD